MSWDFTGIKGTPNPGTVATGTVSSGQIAPWLSENIPTSFIPDPLALRYETTGPWMDPNPEILDPTALSGPNILSTRPEFADLNRLKSEAVARPDEVPGTGGLVTADLVDLLMTAGGAGRGAFMAGRNVQQGGVLRDILRYRMGANPEAGFENVAATVARTAPGAMRPATETAQGLSNIMRPGADIVANRSAGLPALGAAKELVETTLRGELNAVTATAQQQAMQGYTGQYALQRAAQVPDLASQFKALTDELAVAGRGMVQPQTGVNRPTVGGLLAGRSREEIYQEIQQLLSPDQFQRFMAAQTPYAEGSVLSRLFRPSTGEAADVLESQRALQLRARANAKRIDPDLMTSIFRGGETLTPDKPVTLPFRLGNFRLRLPGTVLAGPVGQTGGAAARLLGGTAGGVGTMATMRQAEADIQENAESPGMAAFWKLFNPFMTTPWSTPR